MIVGDTQLYQAVAAAFYVLTQVNNGSNWAIQQFNHLALSDSAHTAAMVGALVTAERHSIACFRSNLDSEKSVSTVQKVRVRTDWNSAHTA